MASFKSPKDCITLANRDLEPQTWGCLDARGRLQRILPYVEEPTGDKIYKDITGFYYKSDEEEEEYGPKPLPDYHLPKGQRQHRYMPMSQLRAIWR